MGAIARPACSEQTSSICARRANRDRRRKQRKVFRDKTRLTSYSCANRLVFLVEPDEEALSRFGAQLPAKRDDSSAPPNTGTIEDAVPCGVPSLPLLANSSPARSRDRRLERRFFSRPWTPIHCPPHRRRCDSFRLGSVLRRILRPSP